MGDPFSADNLSLFEKQTSYPKKPDQAVLPARRASSITTDQVPYDEKLTMSQEVESNSMEPPIGKSNYPMSKPLPKPFEFEISGRPRFRRMHLVVLGILLICVIVLAVTLGVEVHNKADKHGTARADAIPLSDNTTKDSSMSIEKPSSSFSLLTTSSTMTSGFLTITLGVTNTLSPAGAASGPLQSFAPSSSDNLPVQQVSDSPITLTYSLSAPATITYSPTTASASALNSALPDWLGNLVTGKKKSADSNDNIASDSTSTIAER